MLRCTSCHRNLDKLSNLTTLKLSKTGVSSSYLFIDFVLHIHARLFSVITNIFHIQQRDFNNTPHIDKLTNLTGTLPYL